MTNCKTILQANLNAAASAAELSVVMGLAASSAVGLAAAAAAAAAAGGDFLQLSGQLHCLPPLLLGWLAQQSLVTLEGFTKRRREQARALWHHLEQLEVEYMHPVPQVSGVGMKAACRLVSWAFP
eukprot:1142033-Pelagomonas_calceolata.AAC.6